MGTVLDKLYSAAEEIGTLPDGAKVLDIPCGGGVATRGLTPGQDVRYIAADISQQMLDKTMAAARERGVADVVEPVVADVHNLQFADGEFDLVVSFTGLHCFPDPHQAIRELGRVVKSGGRLTGSTLLLDASWRSKPATAVGKRANLLGPGLTTQQLESWLREAGFDDIKVDISGAIGYFRAARR
jgi:ubiquinone/menaquinone biosynthesis C-methylase UbiE